MDVFTAYTDGGTIVRIACRCGRFFTRGETVCSVCGTHADRYVACSCGFTWDKAGAPRCPRCGREDAGSELADLKQCVALLKAENEMLTAAALDLPGLVRACFEVAVMEDAKRIAERPENVEHVLDVMYEKAAEAETPAFWDALTQAEQIRVRLRARKT
jgi:hypothetical protein